MEKMHLVFDVHATLKIPLFVKFRHPWDLGHEVEGEAFHVYVEVSGIKRLKTLEISNATLIDIYDDQINLIHFEHNGKTYTERIDKGQRSANYVIAEL